MEAILLTVIVKEADVAHFLRRLKYHVVNLAHVLVEEFWLSCRVDHHADKI